jgi:putative membrane protein
LNNYLNAGTYFLVTSLIILIVMLVFEMITWFYAKYKIWVEITKGNLSVALTSGGLIFGVANIMRFAIGTHDTLTQTLIWGGLGAATLLIVFYGFELLTPKLDVMKEIGKDNKAVGFISFIFSVAISYIIGASIS